MASVVTIGQLVGGEAIAETEALRDETALIRNQAQQAAAEAEAAVEDALGKLGSYGPRTVFDGTSIDIAQIQTLAGNQNRNASWTNVMAKASRGRILYVYNAAVAGQTLADMLGRFDEFVAPHAPDTVVAMPGVNDTVSTDLFMERLEEYRVKCSAIGARLIVGDGWPSHDSPVGRVQKNRAYSAAIRAWAGPVGVVVIPMQDLALPNGNWRDGWSSDGIHPVQPGSPSTTIGLFAWEAVKHLFSTPVVRRPAANGLDLLANGLFENLSSANPVPTLAAPTTSTASGTLPAGTYEYAVTNRTYSGETPPSVAKAATLATPGTVTLTWDNAGGNAGFHVYRRGPGELVFRRLATTANNVTTYADTGATAIGAAQLSTLDTSRRPVGLDVGQLKYQREGFGGRIVEGVRGTVWRFTDYSDGTQSQNLFRTAAIAPGDIIEASGLVGGAGLGTLTLYFRSANANVGDVILSRDLLTPELGTFWHTLTAPAGTVEAFVYFQVPAGAWMDVGELSVRKVTP
jgi:lysophospholipase L1-like esterase